MQVKEFQKLTGTLNHAAFGIPGGHGLFTPLWIALTKQHNGYVQLTPDVKQTFSDFQWLFNKIVNQLVNVAQLVHCAPGIIGFSDACKYGAGRVWIIPQQDSTNRYLVWSIHFLSSVIKRFESNLLSINNLEMAGVLTHWLVLEHLLPSLQTTPCLPYCWYSQRHGRRCVKIPF